jgi:hypothetical protein
MIQLFMAQAVLAGLCTREEADKVAWRLSGSLVLVPPTASETYDLIMAELEAVKRMSATVKAQHRDELVNALAAAAAALSKAEQAACLWADDVSATVEEQMGVGPSDPQRFTDPVYEGSLRLISAIREARETVERIQMP